MGLRVKDRAKPKLPPVEPGLYISVCVGVIDLGEQLCEYKDRGKTYNNQVQLVWELIGETIEIDGKQEPRQLSRTFNVTVGKKGSLRPFVAGWTSTQYSDDQFKELDLFALIGRACQLNVMLDESGEYANVETAVPLPKGMPAPTPSTPLVTWDTEAWDAAAFALLPEWIQDKLKKSTQYQKIYTPTTAVDFEPPGAVVEAEKGACPI